MLLPDTQSLPDTRQVAIPAVGIAPVRMPLRFLDEENGAVVPIDAEVGLFTDLPAEVRGTHMSRLMEVLMETQKTPITASGLHDVLQQVLLRLKSHTAMISVKFPFYIEKAAPVTRLEAYVPYRVQLLAARLGNQRQLGWRLEVPLTTLCPCSKAISDYGAHNQRGILAVQMAFSDRQRYPDLTRFLPSLEMLGSCPVYALLKRPDEKWVTEKAYESPKFVEDVLRDAVLFLQSRPDIVWFGIRMSNDESIHAHNAVAYYDEALANPTHARPLIFAWET